LRQRSQEIQERHLREDACVCWRTLCEAAICRFLLGFFQHLGDLRARKELLVQGARAAGENTWGQAAFMFQESRWVKPCCTEFRHTWLQAQNENVQGLNIL